MQIYFSSPALLHTTSRKSVSGIRLFQLVVALACAAYLFSGLPDTKAPQSSATSTILTNCD